MTIEAELVERYGANVLSVSKRDIPPRRAAHGRLLISRPRPSARSKLTAELRQHKHKVYCPRDRSTKKPMMGNYLFSEAIPAESRYVQSVIGDVPRAALIRLYPRRDRGHEAPEPFKAGDRVEIKVGTFASMTGTLARKRGRRQWIVDMGGKQVCAQTTSLIRIDPG